MKARSQSLSGWVNELQRVGRYTFTREEAERALSLEVRALDKALQRSCGQGRTHRLRKGFYTIVPLEYAPVGTIPPEWFIDDLMKFIDRPYYVGCLSAAAIHGAAHQRPQELQVVVPRRVKKFGLIKIARKTRLFRKR